MSEDVLGGAPAGL